MGHATFRRNLTLDIFKGKVRPRTRLYNLNVVEKRYELRIHSFMIIKMIYIIFTSPNKKYCILLRKHSTCRLTFKMGHTTGI